jgi:hypothetical protein
MNKEAIYVGQNVHYAPGHGKKENGRIKSVGEDTVFVVFHCAGEWDNFMNYTGQSCKKQYVIAGWVDKDGRQDPAHCDHEYLPSASKWQPINQMDCIHCGHRINT